MNRLAIALASKEYHISGPVHGVWTAKHFPTNWSSACHSEAEAMLQCEEHYRKTALDKLRNLPTFPSSLLSASDLCED